MKAVVVAPSKRTVELVGDHPDEPAVTGQQVRFQVIEVGICGTDREIARFDYGEPPDGSEYFVLGHECLGRIIEVGPDVEALSPGDLVVPSVRRPCPGCPACDGGNQDYCFSGRFTERGIGGAHGFLCERAVEEAKYLSRLPSELERVGCLVEPLTIAEKALLQHQAIAARLPLPERRTCLRALVIGSGPVGLLGAMALRLRGYSVAVVARSPADGNPRARLSAEIGASYFSLQEMDVTALRSAFGEVDLIYEAAGSSEAVFSLVDLLAPNGLCVLTGIPPTRGTYAFDTAALMRNLVLKNQVISGTVNASPRAFSMAIEDLARFEKRWPGVAEKILTNRVPIEEFGACLRGRLAGIKDSIRL